MKFASLLRYLGYSSEKRSWAKEDLESVQKLWEETGFVILRAWQEVLGMSTGRRPAGDKVT